MTTTAENPTFQTYASALEWIERKAREYGGKRKFYASAEYRDAYPAITAAHDASKTDLNADYIAAGYKDGDQVEVLVARHLIFGPVWATGTMAINSDGAKAILDKPFKADGAKRSIRTLRNPKLKPKKG